MSAQHTSSMYPGRSGGPLYCLNCGQDWPCQGSFMEKQEREALSRIGGNADRIADLERRVAALESKPSAEQLGEGERA